MKASIIKKTIALGLAVASVMAASAQGVGIGDKDFTPNAAAMLEVQSKTKGVLFPRMTYTERMYIQANAQSVGLLVYQTDKDAGYYYWDGLAWKFLSPSQTAELPIFALVATTGSYADLTNKPAFAAIATTGDYNDLQNKPTIPGGSDVSWATVATSGSYNDLVDKPAIPTRLQDLEQDANYYTTVSKAEREYWNGKASLSDIPTRLQDLAQDENYYSTITRAERDKWNAAAQASTFSGNYNDLTDKPALKAVATSGSYNDLSDKPTIPGGSDVSWATVASSGSYNDLIDKPTIPTRLQDLEQDANYYTTVSRAEREYWNGKANISDIPTRLQDLQQDENYYTTVSKAEREKWNAAAQSSTFSGNYNDLADKPALKAVATSGSYNDLSDKPTFSVNLGTNGDSSVSLSTVALTGSYNDLKDKPVIPGSNDVSWATVASSGSYNDLIDKPAIPTRLQDLQQDETYYTTVSRSERESWNGKANISDIPTRLQDLIQDENYYTTVSKAERDAWNAKSSFSGNYADLNGQPTLATVATSGSYNDLSDKPTSLFATVASTGSYTDLSDKPAIPTRLQDLAQDDYYATVSRTEREYWNGKADIADIPTRLQDLAQDENYYTTISKAERERWDAAAQASGFSGSYDDLTNKPRLGDLVQDENYYTTISKEERDKWNAKSNFSGNYRDLEDKPTIPEHLKDLTTDEYYQTVSRGEKETWNSKVSQADLNDFVTPTERSNWNAAAANATTAVTKTKLSDFDSNDDSKHYTVDEKTKLAGIAAGAEVNVNPDWSATSGDAQILNKPTTLFAFDETDYSKHYTITEKTKLEGIATGAEVNVNPDWNASGGDAQILNKPDLGTLAAKSSISNADVASDAAIAISKINITDGSISASKISGISAVGTSGSYDDLEDKPTIPANIVTYTADQNDNITYNRDPTLKISGGSNTTFGQSLEEFIVSNTAIKDAIVAAILENLSNSNTQTGTNLQKAVIGAALPVGTIAMWRRSSTDLPCGWDEVTEMKSRFPVGTGQGSGLSNYVLGATGGEEMHTLTINEMPSHSHPPARAKFLNPSNWANTDSGGTKRGMTEEDERFQDATGFTGGGNAHENRPPYYGVIFIEKNRNCIDTDNVFN